MSSVSGWFDEISGQRYDWVTVGPDRIDNGSRSALPDRRGYGLSTLVDLSGRDGFSVYLTSRDIAERVAGVRVTFGSKSGGSIRGTMVQVVVSPADDRSG